MLFGGPQLPAGGLGIWTGVMKANGVTANGTVNAGPLGYVSTAVNQKANGNNRMFGDFAFGPTCFATLYDPDWADGNTWNVGGFF